MTDRTYGQFCALASALDVIGERWTLLIIRELLPGPRRFKDLMKGLPGISTNLLCQRLKRLEQEGVVCRRVLPPPAGSTVYALTATGQALETAMVELERWGSRWLPASPDGVALPSLGAISLAIQAFFRPDRARGISETYELRVGDEALMVQIWDGELHVQQGQARQPAAVIHTDMPTFLGLFTGRLTADEALAGDLTRVEGEPEALSRFLHYCLVPGPSDEARTPARGRPQ